MPDAASPVSDFIGAATACKILKDVHRTTLTRWVAEGVLPAVSKLPGKNGAFIFERATVERFAAEREAAGAA